MCAGLRLAENHQGSSPFWWWALTPRWIVMHTGEVFHSHMPNISRSRRTHSGHVLSKCHFYYRPGWRRKTARTQPMRVISLPFSTTHWHLTAWCWRGLKNQFTSIFLFFYGLFFFLIPRFPYRILWGTGKSKKELCFISYCDLEHIPVNVNIHRSWRVL